MEMQERIVIHIENLTSLSPIADMYKQITTIEGGISIDLVMN